jgi:hypothetical protein
MRSNVSNCARITITGGYPAAVRHFETTKRPRNTTWSDDERPLYNTRSHHYRLVRGEDGAYYDVVLYRTPMLRLFKPNEDGTRSLCLRAHPTVASHDFMRIVCGFNYAPLFWTPEGDRAHVPLSFWPQAGKRVDLTPQIPSGFSALVTLDADGKLIRERSSHYMPYTAVMSDEDKAVRAAWTAKLATFIDMLMLRRDYFHSTATPRMSDGKPFRGIKYRAWTGRDAFTQWGDVGEREFASMENLAKLVYTRMLSSRMYDSRENVKPAPIKVTDFRANYTRVLFEMMGLDKRNGKKLLGMFPASLPQQYRFD